MAKIIQGEQYELQIAITNGSTAITPDNCDDIKIKVDTIEKTYSDGELTYDSENGCWLFPLTQEETLGFSGISVQVQAQYILDDVVLSTSRASIKTETSIIRSVFE